MEGAVWVLIDLAFVLTDVYIPRVIVPVFYGLS